MKQFRVSKWLLGGLLLVVAVALVDFVSGDRAFGAFGILDILYAGATVGLLYPVWLLLVMGWVLAARRYRYVADENGIALHPVMNFWRLRPVLVAWDEIEEIEVRRFIRSGYPVLRLSDGSRLWVWIPPRVRRDHSAESVETLREAHARFTANAVNEATAVTADTGRRTVATGPSRWRPRDSALAAVSAVVILINLQLLAWGSEENAGSGQGACAAVPTELIRTVLGNARAFPRGDRCTWAYALPDPGGIDLDIGLWSPNVDRYVRDLSRDRGQYGVRPVRVSGAGSAYVWASEADARYLRAGAEAYARGRSVRVMLTTDRVTSKVDAQRQAVDLLTAVVSWLDRTG